MHPQDVARASTTAMPATAGPSVRLREEAYSENFPVASRLLAANVRPHVMAFYNFVRAGDQLADLPGLSAEDRLRGLDALDRGLRAPDEQAPPEAVTLHRSVQQTGIGEREALTLLEAFRQDVRKRRYANYDELLGYCRLSADPVGHFLLRLHGEDESIFPASDALCTALQILNHLQDVRDDYLLRDRVYLPLDWLDDAGCPIETLAESRSDPRLRRVLDRTLEAIAPLLARAGQLAPAIRDRRMRLEAAVITALAKGLHGRLMREDPLAGRVKLGRLERVARALVAVLRAIRA